MYNHPITQDAVYEDMVTIEFLIQQYKLLHNEKFTLECKSHVTIQDIFLSCGHFIQYHDDTYAFENIQLTYEEIFLEVQKVLGDEYVLLHFEIVPIEMHGENTVNIYCISLRLVYMLCEKTDGISHTGVRISMRYPDLGSEWREYCRNMRNSHIISDIEARSREEFVCILDSLGDFVHQTEHRSQQELPHTDIAYEGNRVSEEAESIF